jgi:hypothetical protein
MQTIIWFLQFLLTLTTSSLGLYLYLSHTDLDNGIMEPLELSKIMSEIVPYEVSIHFLLNLGFLLNGNYFLFLFNLPLLALHARLIAKKEYQFHAISSSDYTDKAKNQTFYQRKMFFYGALIVFVLLRFMFAFSNMAIYNIFGNDYTLVFFGTHEVA